VRSDSSKHQRDVVRREFEKQASNFEAAGSLFRDSSILEWIASHVDVPPGSAILDVAGGTGQLGRHLVQAGGSAVIVDLTDAMLNAGLRAVQEEGRDDVVFVRGDATALPFPDRQFDVVVSRFALHHMDEPGRAIAEMVRVCRPEGSVTLIDMVSGGSRHDELERLRDPSHTSALSRERLVELLRDAGFEGAVVAEREHTMDASRWLGQAHGTPGPVEAALGAEAQGGPPTGLHARLVGGALQITQVWVILAGTAGQGLEPQLPEPESGVLPITPPGKGAGRAV
jgi:ubiquinone/menaquinone biosynthesis C-methylase UbiE